VEIGPRQKALKRVPGGSQLKEVGNRSIGGSKLIRGTYGKHEKSATAVKNNENRRNTGLNISCRKRGGEKKKWPLITEVHWGSGLGEDKRTRFFQSEEQLGKAV